MNLSQLLQRIMPVWFSGSLARDIDHAIDEQIRVCIAAELSLINAKHTLAKERAKLTFLQAQSFPRPE